MGATRTASRNGQASRQALTKNIGATGLEVSWGYVHDDFLREWRGREKVKRVNEMLRNSPVVGALRVSMEMILREADWYYTSESGNDDPRLELLNEAMDKLKYPFRDHISDALLAIFYGWEKSTIIYQRVNGRLLWHRFKMLGHDTLEKWLFDSDTDELVGVQQLRQLWPDPIPVDRLQHYVFRNSRGNPEGESILRPAWIPWFYLKNLQQVEAIGIERNIAGMPVITPPMGADMTESSGEDTDYGRAHAIVRNVRQDEQGGVVLPPPTGEGDHNRWCFELVSATGGSKVVDTNMVISRYEKRILMSCLAQFLMLGMDNVGALATFEGGNDFFTAAVNGVADIIADSFTKQATHQLLYLNGYESDGIKLQHSPVGDLDLPSLGDFFAKVSPFLTFTAEDEIWLRSLMRMPEKGIDELERIRDEEQARKDAIARQIQQGIKNSQDSNDTPDDADGTTGGMVDENAIFFASRAAGAAPDDAERRRQERKWYQTAVKYFTGQEKRVLSGAKEIAR